MFGNLHEKKVKQEHVQKFQKGIQRKKKSRKILPNYTIIVMFSVRE